MAFKELTESDKPFLAISQNTISLLESITPAEKAQAVPHLKIWEIDPRTGKATGESDSNGEPLNPLSVEFVRPASFGNSVEGQRFRERPPVSIETMTVTTNAPQGVILYRSLAISLVVHRPDAIFDEDSSWSSLITPGRCFIVEYGWRSSIGVKNGILNGQDHVDEKTNVVVPSLQRLRFVVTNYSFRITTDMQVAIEIQGMEDGDYVTSSEPFANSKTDGIASDILDPFDPVGQEIVRKMKDLIRKNSAKKKGSKGKPDTMSLKDVCDSFFAPIIEDSYRRLGYRIDLYLGQFNSRCGSCIPRYGGLNLGSQSIGQILIPVSELAKVLSDLLRTGRQITMQNFMMYFLKLLNNPEIFTNSEKLPDIRVKTVYANTVKRAQFFIIDLKNELTKLDPDDKKEAIVTGKPTREKVKEILDKKGIPYISFIKGNSYIIDSSFDVQQDDVMKSIFMQRALLKKGTRDEKVEQTDIGKVANKIPHASRVLYSSAVTGEISMLGNFAFDTFSLIWLDFGIPTWSGPFFTMGKTDVITRGSFVSTVSVRAAGDDPLGTQAANS